MFETLLCMIVCIVIMTIVYFCASIFVYMTVFGLPIKDALKHALRELLFWKELNNDNNEND